MDGAPPPPARTVATSRDHAWWWFGAWAAVGTAAALGAVSFALWIFLLPLAAAGAHVVAPDQRGYGRTTGWDCRYDGDLAQFHLLNLAKDVLGLVAALRRSSVAAIVGHDFGSPVAAWCALLHPDVFRSAVLMSAPFAGPPRPTVYGAPTPTASLADSLAALRPPRCDRICEFSRHV